MQKAMVAVRSTRIKEMAVCKSSGRHFI